MIGEMPFFALEEIAEREALMRREREIGEREREKERERERQELQPTLESCLALESLSFFPFSFHEI